MNKKHGFDPATVERQCPLCAFTCSSMEELAEHSQSIHCPYICNICFLHFSAEYKLQDHRHEEHKVNSMGTSVEVGDQGDQALEPQQPEDSGTAKPLEKNPRGVRPKQSSAKTNRLENMLPDSCLKIYRDGRRRKKRKRKRGTMRRVTMTRMMMKHTTRPRISAMTAKMITTSGIQERNTGMQMKKGDS